MSGDLSPPAVSNVCQSLCFFRLSSFIVFLLCVHLFWVGLSFQKGDQEATVHTLDAMMDFNLTQEMCLLAIKENGGIEILLNLLDTVEVECQVSCQNGRWRGPADMNGVSCVPAFVSVTDTLALGTETGYSYNTVCLMMLLFSTMNVHDSVLLFCIGKIDKCFKTVFCLQSRFRLRPQVYFP